MSPQRTPTAFQDAIETVEALPPEDQDMLIELLRKRRIEQRRAELVAEVAEARREYKRGKVRPASVADIVKEITK